MARHWRSAGLLSTAVSAIVVLGAGPVLAQATGQVQVSSGASGSARLDRLQQLLLLPPEARLNLFVVPEFQHEEFEGYEEDAVVFDSRTDAPGDTVPGGVKVPDFNVTAGSISLGADYLFTNGVLVGASLNYTKADFDFDGESPASAQRALLDNPSDASRLGVGDPLDREFDEYGGTAAVGYIAEPWTILLAGSYSQRNIETERREYNSAIQFFQNEAEFDSDNYAVDLGVAYRITVVEGMIQPQVSVGYRREEVDGYTERLGRQFDDDPSSPFVTGDFVSVGPDDPGFDRTQDTRRRFNDQTIESIPLTLGVLFGYPFDTGVAGPDPVFGLSGIRFGASYTHDFADQERTVRAESIRFPDFSVEFQEENRNRDFATLTGSLEFDLFGLRSTFSYEHVEGFDERERADRLRLQLRVPL